MALPTPPLRTRKRCILAAAQASQGTAATLDATSGMFIVYTDDTPFKITINKDERPYMDGVKKYASSLGSQMATLSFDAEIIGAATVPAWASALLPACGFVLASRTFTFDPLNITPLPLMTLGINEGGRLRSIIDAQGVVKFSAESGKRGMASFVFSGVLQDDADAAMVTPTRPTTVPPRFITAPTLGSYTPRISKFEIDCGADVIMREAASPTGFYSALLVDAAPKLTMDPEADLVANQPLLSVQKASTELAWSIVLGTVTSNIVTFAGSKAELMETNEGARNKLITDSITANLNDLLTIQFS